MSLVELARYSDATLAHIVRARLGAAGIPAYCFDTGMNLAESVPLLFQVRLMIDRDDLEAAEALLGEDADASEAPFVEPEQDVADEEPEAAGPSRTARRRQRMAGLVVGYVMLCMAFAVVLTLALPAEPLPIEVEAFD